MIGGNITGILQKKTSGGVNAIGEKTVTWLNLKELTGWLDLSNGDTKYTTYNAKIQESTHVFVTDYQPISEKSENTRMLINDQIYDVKLIDDPMEMHRQIEIYLKFVGGQSG